MSAYRSAINSVTCCKFVYLSKLWVVDVTKAVRYDLLIYCLLSDIILYFLLVAATSLRAGFQVYLS